MKGKLLIAAVAAIGLFGCVPTKQEIIQEQANTCRAYGYQPGTHAYVQCVELGAQLTETQLQRQHGVLELRLHRAAFGNK